MPDCQKTQISATPDCSCLSATPAALDKNSAPEYELDKTGLSHTSMSQMWLSCSWVSRLECSSTFQRQRQCLLSVKSACMISHSEPGRCLRVSCVLSCVASLSLPSGNLILWLRRSPNTNPLFAFVTRERLGPVNKLVMLGRHISHRAFHGRSAHTIALGLRAGAVRNCSAQHGQAFVVRVPRSLDVPFEEVQSNMCQLFSIRNVKSTDIHAL